MSRLAELFKQPRSASNAGSVEDLNLLISSLEGAVPNPLNTLSSPRLALLRAVVFDIMEEREVIPTVAEMRLLMELLSSGTAPSQVAPDGDLVALLLQAPVAIAIVEGPSHVFRFANPAYAELVGKQALVGKTLSEALPELEGQGFDELLNRVKSSGKPLEGREVPIRLSRASGDEDLVLDFTYTPLRDSAGIVTGVLASCADVTAQVTSRRQAQSLAERLRENEEHLRSVVKASGAGLWNLNVASGDIEADARMTELMGLAPGITFSLSSALDGLVDAADRPLVSDAVSAALRGDNEGRYRIEFRTGGKPACRFGGSRAVLKRRSTRRAERFISPA